MKPSYLLLLSLLLAFVLPCHAQYSSFFGQHSTGWKIVCHNLDEAWPDSVYTVSDTLINSRSYRKATYRSGGLTIFFREDTITGRAWCLKPGGSCAGADTTEMLICDMSLNVSDTFNRGCFGGMGVDTLMIVDSVYMDRGHRVVRLKARHPVGYAARDIVFFTEGIGPGGSFVWMYGCTLCLDPYLLCSYKDEVQTDYPNAIFNGDCNPQLTGVKDLEEVATTLYPNPAGSFVNLPKTYPDSDRFTIYDMSGRLVLDIARSVGASSPTIDLSTLPEGIYRVNLKNAKGFSAVYKLSIAR